MPQTNTARFICNWCSLIRDGDVDCSDRCLRDTVGAMELPKSTDETPSDPEVVERELQILSNFLNSQLRGDVSELAALD